MTLAQHYAGSSLYQQQRGSPLAHASRFTAISLFSGAMGLDLGLERTDRFRLLACVEKETAYCDTIRLNQAAGRLPKDLQIYEADISTLDPSKMLDSLGLKPGELDVLVGGPPCQSFSTAGRRQATQDPRGTLLWQYLRFVEVMKPKMFLMENVRGLLSAALKHRPLAERPERGGPPLSPDESPGSVVRLFANDLRALSGASYHLDCFEVNAVNYGAPQIRERAIFIGNRFGLQVEFPKPTHGISEAGTPYEMSLLEAGAKLKPWATLRDAIGDYNDPNPVIMDFSPRKKAYLAMVPPGSNWRSLPENIQIESMGKAYVAKGGRSGWWRRLTFDLPCPTLVTMPNHASTSLCHPLETRALSVGEYAKIQEFPNEWIIAGKVVEQYTQIGNAVPVRLGEIAGRVIASELDKLAERGWQANAEGPSDYRIVYIQSHIRTRRWYTNGKTHIWDDGGANGASAYSKPKTRRKESCLGLTGGKP